MSAPPTRQASSVISKLRVFLVGLVVIGLLSIQPTFARVVSITGLCTGDTTNGNTYTISVTPAIGDLIVVFAGSTATVGTAAISDPFGSGTYTQVRSQVKAASSDTLWVFVRDALVPSSSTNNVALSITGDDGTGAILCAAIITGITKFGTDAIVQSAGQSNQSGGTTPAPVFGASTNTNNITLGMVFNATNPAGITHPTNWDELDDDGYASPTAGGELISRVSGFSGTTLTWGGTSASAFASAVAEVDTSSGAAATPSRMIGIGVGLPSHRP